ncbi:POTRA domain-containing protein [uncultured Algibacter sp.]|uniref:POTRA domain-containing protein n=1 Tax=uncultured Algibacter sp. TaxID=298659 RepID=UPI0032167E4A
MFGQSLHLKITGNNEFETNAIDSLNYSKTHKDYNAVTNEIDSIQKSLSKLGYIENELKKIKKINDSIYTASIHLKNKYKTIYVYYNKDDIETSTLNHISKRIFDTYFELDFTTLEYALDYINSKISEKGFPFSKLYLSDIKIKDSIHLKASLIIESKKQKRIINDIVIKGYEKFPKSYLKHFLKIKKSQVFDLKTIRKKTEELNNLRFASEIKSPEVLFSKDSTTLYLYINKTKSNAFDGFLGFGSNEDTNELEFDGYLNLNLTNNLNFGESFRLLYKSDENDQKTFEVNTSIPYIFKTPVGLDLLLRIFKRDSSFTTINQSVKLNYQINSKHKVYTGITSTESNNLLEENTSQSIADYKTQYYNLGYQFLKPQLSNLLFPIKSKAYLETNFGKRKTSIDSEKQSQFTIDAFDIINLNNKNSFYLRTNGSYLISDTYFENELLRFGGINSIRGFEENSLFASLYGLINTEYRYKLNNSIYVHTIFDAAYFENDVSKTKEKLFSYGFGFGILTKTGLLKFNYANGKNENSRFKLSNSKIHLSLIASF